MFGDIYSYSQSPATSILESHHDTSATPVIGSGLAEKTTLYLTNPLTQHSNRIRQLFTFARHPLALANIHVHALHPFGIARVVGVWVIVRKHEFADLS